LALSKAAQDHEMDADLPLAQGTDMLMPAQNPPAAIQAPTQLGTGDVNLLKRSAGRVKRSGNDKDLATLAYNDDINHE
jgi:hypothetical protein